MVYLPPPQVAKGSRASYAEAYSSILSAHRKSPSKSASSVVILVAPDVDALCAARMLADLFKQDDVIYRIVPVSGISELEKVRDEMATYADLLTLILLNMGSILDLPSPEWFGEFDPRVTVHIIDSARPQNLSSVFGGGENGNRIIVWDDGGAEFLEEERKAWEALTFEPEPDSDEDSELDSDEETSQLDETDDYEVDISSPSSKRRSLGEGSRLTKRRKVTTERPKRMSRDERDMHSGRLEKYYMAGTWYGQSTAGVIYVLATVLEREDNEFLWLAILGLTHQYISSRISRDKYEGYHAAYYDDVCRLNPVRQDGGKGVASSPDDTGIRTTEELRFVLFRHWNLYDAMFHSSYVASKLGIWRERGRKKLSGLLAKMGFSMLETQQPYTHMALELKRDLIDRLNEHAPEYGLVELSYPSFTRSYGFRSQPLSASDAVEGISALLDVAGGVRMEVEVEGSRNGGEWFGGGRAWEGPESGREARRRQYENRENVPPGGEVTSAKNHDAGKKALGKLTTEWWVKNFWTAFDALRDIESLRQSLSLSMSVHRAIIRQGTSIIDKQDIKTMRNHRVVVLTQGPDLALFSHPGVLSRLALWLVDALRDKIQPGINPRTKKRRKNLPFVVACLNEAEQSYIIVGVTAALDFGDVRKNQFGLAFLDAKERCNARTRHSSFDTSVLEINQDDLKVFLETLCEAADAY